MNMIKKQIAYNRGVRKERIQYIVIHDTGNRGKGADALAHFNYFDGGNRNSSADFFVDSTQVIQVNDYKKYYTYHCGDGKGKYGITNANSIGIEMCINADGDYQKAFANTVEVTRKLMEEIDIPVERVVRHYDASRKNCPASMSGNGWALWKEFENLVTESGELTMQQYEELKQEIKDLTETIKVLATELHNLKNPMIYNYVDENMPEWARPTITKLMDKGYLKGDEEGRLNLDENMLRMLVINDRAGVYGCW